ncbi:MAG: porin [Candidatus Binatia bacterium]
MTSARNRGGARLAYTVLVASTVLLPRLARARDLTEILADKEVITLDEKKEATRTITKPTIVYKEGKGFTFATPDDRFSLSVGGRLQVRYTLTDIDSAFVNPQKGVEDSQSFDIPRARLWWEGNAFTPRLKYKIQIDVAGGGGDILRDAELEYEIIDDKWLAVVGGQMKTPFCRQEMTSSGRLEFVDRSLACSNFRFERARGIQFRGTPMNALIEYYAGVFNTTGRNGPVNPDDNFLYVTRFAINPFGPIPYSEGDFEETPSPLVAIGVNYGYEKAKGSVFTSAATVGPSSADPDVDVITANGSAQNQVPFLRMIQPYYNKLANPNAITANVHNLGTDLAARWMGFDLNFEYFLGFVSNDAWQSAAPGLPYVLPASSFDNHGYYVQAGYFIIPKKLQIAARYSELNANTSAEVKTNTGRKVSPYQDELLGAISYYFWQHNLKIQTDFGPVTNTAQKNVDGGISDKNDFRWRVQAQLIF